MVSCVSDSSSGPQLAGGFPSFFSFKDSTAYKAESAPVHVWLTDSSKFAVKFLSASLDTSVFTYSVDSGMSQTHNITFTPKVGEALNLERDTAIWKINVLIAADNEKGRVSTLTVDAWLVMTK